MPGFLKIFLPILFISSIAFGQNRQLTQEEMENSSLARIDFLNPETSSGEIDELFEKDVKNNTIFLYLSGGIAPVRYEKDEVFEEKYGIYFYDFGCVSPSYEYVMTYNQKVFDLLKRKFGKTWIKEIRKDVPGLKGWKKKNS